MRPGCAALRSVAGHARHGGSRQHARAADEAFAEPINAAMPDAPYAYGTLIGSMAWEKNIDPPLSPLWISESVATLLFRQRVLKEKVN